MSEKKKKKTSQKMNRWLFLALWILTHSFAWGGTFWLVDSINPSSDWEIILAFVIVLGIVPGSLLSVPQRWLMRRGLGLNINWWRRASIVAWGLGGILLWGGVEIFDLDNSVLGIILAWFSPLILAQYMLMRRHIQKAFLLALANLASLIVFIQFIDINSSPDTWRFAGAGTLQGAVTGLTLLWLYGMAQQEKAKHKKAQDDTKIKRLSDGNEESDYQLEEEAYSASSTSLS